MSWITCRSKQKLDSRITYLQTKHIFVFPGKIKKNHIKIIESFFSIQRGFIKPLNKNLMWWATLKRKWLCSVDFRKQSCSLTYQIQCFLVFECGGGKVDWLIDCSFFSCFPLKTLLLIRKRHCCRWLLRHARGCWGPIQTWILPDPHCVPLRHTRECWGHILPSPLTLHMGMWRTHSKPDPHGSPFSRLLRHTRWCRGPILNRILTVDVESLFLSRLFRHIRGGGGPIITRIHTGPHAATSYDTNGMRRTHSNPNPYGSG
jgi:hypothetical protein